MCHSNPMRWVILLTLSASVAEAQTWRKLGGSAIEIGLAALAGGPVAQVWFSDDGSRLFAKTQSDLTFVTSDFETWTAAPPDSQRPDLFLDRAPFKVPESKSTFRQAGAGRIYAFGDQIYSTDDGGRTWLNLTALNGHSVIGEGQHDLAASPADPLFIAVANDEGVWASHDGGLSWNGLNDNLPNLPVRTLLPKTGIEVDRLGSASFNGRAGWVAVEPDPSNARMRTAISARLGVPLTATSGSGDFWYAGAADGRIWTSADARAHWTLSTIQASGSIERFAIDADAPRIALVAASGRGAHLFRTVNGGQTWDDITGVLSDAPAHGIAMDRTDGVAYAATDRGVFLSRMDLNVIGTASPWVDVSAGLPTGAIVEDVRLESNGQQLAVAVDGYGVYVERAPHQIGSAKLVNAADLSNRAAAPGGLVSAVGLVLESVSAGGRQFPVLAQSQIQVPFETEPAQLQLEVNRSVRIGLSVKAVSPAVFVDRDGAPLLLDPETGMMLDGTQPMQARSSLQLLATGLGRVTPDWPSGVPAPSANVPVVAVSVQAFLNGTPVEVVKATLAPGYVGMYLVEIRLPTVLDAGAADLYVTAAGETSNHVRLSVSY